MTPKNNMRQLNINLFFFIWAITKGCKLNPLTPMSDQDRISPYNININQIGDENEEKYEFGNN